MSEDPEGGPSSEVPTPMLRFAMGGAGSEAAPDPDGPARLFERMRRTGRPWVRTLQRLVWPGVWLVFTGYSINDIVTKHWGAGETALAWASLLVFAVLYMVAMWLATAFEPGPRPRRRLIPYVACVVLIIAMALGFGGNFGGLLIFAGVVTGWTLRPRVALVVLALLMALVFSGLTVGYALGDVLFDAFMAGALGVTMMSFRAVIWLVIELHSARSEVARLAVAEERLRFSRDLHDVLGHSLSVIALKSQVARRLIPTDAAAAQTALSELESVAQESLASVREMVSGYRQLSLEDELQSAAEVLGAAGIAVEVGHGERDLTPGIDSLLAWTVREGVTNVLRHSRARACLISILSGADGVRLEMTDDGAGAAAADGGGEHVRGTGLSGLRERMAAVGGTLEAGPSPQGGFRLSVHLPTA